MSDENGRSQVTIDAPSTHTAFHTSLNFECGVLAFTVTSIDTPVLRKVVSYMYLVVPFFSPKYKETLGHKQMHGLGLGTC